MKLNRDKCSLEKPFRIRLAAVQEDLMREKNIKMVGYDYERDPFNQARMWRKSRTTEEINNQIRMLKHANADYLAYCIEAVGPQKGEIGKHVTWAIPGTSWHQWGLAADCYWEVEGRAIWSIDHTVNGVNGYIAYREACIKHHLTVLRPELGDWPHCQWRPEGSPLEIYSLSEINDAMNERYGYLQTVT